MTINDGVDFIYANESSTLYGVKLATSIGSTSRSVNIETRNIITTKNSFTNIFSFHGTSYDSPLSFDVIIYNEDGSYIDAYKERQLKKWLLKNSYNWLQVNQDSLANVLYCCIGVSAEIIDVGAYSGGLKVNFQADSPNAWSKLYQRKYTTLSNTLNFNIYIDCDYDDYIIYPQLKIKALSSGTVSIKNNTTNKTLTISDCVTNEIISVDCQEDILESNTERVLIDKWNQKFIEMKEGKNEFALTGNFELIVEYRLPIRVGG